MAHLRIHPPWQGRSVDVSPEDVFWNRRRFLKTLGWAGAGGLAILAGCDTQSTDPAPMPAATPTDGLRRLTGVAAQAGDRVTPARSLTPYVAAASFNNFYEFTVEREAVWRQAAGFVTSPWAIEVSGLTRRPGAIDLDQIMAVAALEERIYRHRCVEAWAMTVPWIGFPLAELVRFLEPEDEATHIRFVTAYDPESMRNQNYVWPYYEALELEEAMHELAFLTVGLYGHVLPPQNGAPVRVVLPWKYGYKSIKSIARIEFVSEQPRTFWNDIDSRNYTFHSNVDPTVPHTNWSQAEERLLDSGDVVATLPYNGYGEWVASLY